RKKAPRPGAERARRWPAAPRSAARNSRARVAASSVSWTRACLRELRSRERNRSDSKLPAIHLEIAERCASSKLRWVESARELLDSVRQARRGMANRL